MADSSDEEPAWLVEQTSAQKAAATRRALDSDDDDFSISVESPENDGEGASKSKGAAAGGKKAVAGASGDSKVAATAADPKAKVNRRAPPSARLPLQLAPKVRRDVLLVEAPDTSLDLSGDFGCIGKLHVRKGGAAAAGSSSANDAGDGSGRVAELRQSLMLDLKGKVYDADILPCNTLCLVQVDGAKAKVEAVFSDYVQLAAPRDSIFDMQEVASGAFDADFFDGDDVLSQVGSNAGDSDAELGPLKEHRDGKKGKAKPKKKAAGKGGAGAKRKSAGGGGNAAKKAKK